MTTLYAIGGLVVALAVAIWFAMRSARNEGAATANAETLADAAERGRKADEILARAIPGPDDVLIRMRRSDGQP